MVYRFTSSFFALLLCVELTASPSLHAMKENEVEFEEQKKVQVPPVLSKEQRKKEIKKAREDLCNCEDILKLKEKYEIYKNLSPDDLGEAEHDISNSFFGEAMKSTVETEKVNYLKESLHFKALAILRNDDPHILEQATANDFIITMAHLLRLLKDTDMFNAFLLTKTSKFSWETCSEITYLVKSNLILNNMIKHKFSIESYEVFFKIVCRDLFQKNQNMWQKFLIKIHDIKKTESIFISHMYLHYIFDKKEKIKEKYEILKRIATDVLFINNSPPFKWITRSKPYIIADFIELGFKFEEPNKINFIEEYAQVNTKDDIECSKAKTNTLLMVYLTARKWEDALKQLYLRRKFGFEIKEGRIILSIKEINLLKLLGRDQEADEIARNNPKTLKGGLKLPQFNKGLGKLALFSLFGKDKEVNEQLLKLQKECLNRFNHRPTSTKKEAPSQPKKVPNPPVMPKEQKTPSPKKEIVKKTAPKKDVVKKTQTQKTSIMSNNNINQQKFNEPMYYTLNTSSEESRKNKQEILKLHNEKSEKVKTKGISNPPQENNTNVPQNNNNLPNKETTPQKEESDISEILKGTPLKTLNNLFRPFSENIGWDKLNISYAKIESLFKALDHKTGIPTGDHVKVTINKEGQFDNNENNNNKEQETMLTLVKKTKVCAAALEQMAKAFILYGIYPSELEETLREKGYLPKKKEK